MNSGVSRKEKEKIARKDTRDNAKKNKKEITFSVNKSTGPVSFSDKSEISKCDPSSL